MARPAGKCRRCAAAPRARLRFVPAQQAFGHRPPPLRRAGRPPSQIPSACASLDSVWRMIAVATLFVSSAAVRCAAFRPPLPGEAAGYFKVAPAEIAWAEQLVRWQDVWTHRARAIHAARGLVYAMNALSISTGRSRGPGGHGLR